MANFNLYIDRIEDSIQQYKKYRNKCVEDTTYYYSVLKNVDNSWVDHNTETFLEKVKKDENKVEKYFSYMDSLYNEIDTFKDNVISILNRYGCNGHISTLSYDNTRIRKCIDYIENSIYYIDKAINSILSITYPADFKALDLVNEVLNRLYNLKNNLYYCENNISNLSIEITNEVSNSRVRKSRIETFNERFDTFDYNWSTVEMDINSSRFQADEEDIVSSKKAKIDEQEDLEINGLSDNVVLKVAGTNDMEKTDVVEITGLNDGIDYKTASGKEFDRAETQKIVGLNDNVEVGQASNKKTESSTSIKVDNLDENIELKDASNKLLDSEKTYEVDKLNEGIEEQKATESSFEFKSNDIDLGKIEEFDKKDNSMDISSNFNNEGSLNVKTYDQNSSSVSMDSNHTYDLSDGIKKFNDVSSASMNMNSSGNYDVSSNISKIGELNHNNIILDNN